MILSNLAVPGNAHPPGGKIPLHVGRAPRSAGVTATTPSKINHLQEEMCFLCVKGDLTQFFKTQISIHAQMKEYSLFKKQVRKKNSQMLHIKVHIPACKFIVVNDWHQC